MSAPAIALLREIAALAAERRALPEGLRASGLAGSSQLADALQAGADLPTALAGLVPKAVAAELSRHRDLALGACLAADEWEAAGERRQALRTAVMDPLLSAAAMVAILFGLHHWLGLRPVGSWWLLALPAPLVVLLAVLPWPRSWPLGPIAAWRRHAATAGRYARAAVVVRWRLPEAEASRLLGADLAGLGPMLGSPAAEASCQRLRDHHRRAARRASRRLAWIIGSCCYLAAAGVALSAMDGYWRTYFDRAGTVGARP